MGRIGIFGFALACLPLVSLTAQAAFWIPVVPVAGSTQTDITGINDNDEIVGYYLDSEGVEHGFFGTLDGNYTFFDYDDANDPGTVIRAISNDGHMTGYANTNCGHSSCIIEFERNPDGSAVPIKNGQAVLDGMVAGINKSGEFVGDYFDADGTFHGYTGKAGRYKQDIALPFENVGVHGRGIGTSGAIAGWFVDTTGSNYVHGFLQANGTTSQVDFPNPVEKDTYLSGMSGKGLIVGAWDNGNSNKSFGFEYDPSSNTFTSIKPPHAKYTQVSGANDAGLLAVGADVGPFVYCPQKKSQCPSGGIEVADPTSVHP
jgi:hypothetical protein